MSAIAVISIFICLFGSQISAQNLRTAESRREQAELYARGHDHQTVGSSLGGPSYGGSGGYGSTYGNGGYGHGSYGGYEQSGHSSFGGGSYGAGSNYGLNPSYGDGFVGASLDKEPIQKVDKNNAPSSKPSIKEVANAHIFSNRLSNAAKDQGNVASRSASENVGSAHLSNYHAYQIPGSSYPSLAPHVNCGSKLLISCSPTYQYVPSSSYSSYSSY